MNMNSKQNNWCIVYDFKVKLPVLCFETWEQSVNFIKEQCYYEKYAHMFS